MDQEQLSAVWLAPPGAGNTLVEMGLVSAASPRADYYIITSPSGGNRAIPTPWNIMCELWNARAAARSTLETERPLAFLSGAAFAATLRSGNRITRGKK